MPKYYPELSEKISDFLKTKKLKFNLDNEADSVHEFVFYVGGSEAFIQVEYSDVEEYPEPEILFFSNQKSDGNSLYNSTITYSGDDSEIEADLEQLIDFVKNFNQIVTKIENKITQINELCEELGLDPEEFISVNYDFDE